MSETTHYGIMFATTGVVFALIGLYLLVGRWRNRRIAATLDKAKRFVVLKY